MAQTGPTLAFQSVDEELAWTQEQSGRWAGIEKNRVLSQTDSGQ
jgi:hypothetical protein